MGFFWWVIDPDGQSRVPWWVRVTALWAVATAVAFTLTALVAFLT